MQLDIQVTHLLSLEWKYHQFPWVMESEYKYSGQKFLGLLLRNESPKNYELLRVANFFLFS